MLVGELAQHTNLSRDTIRFYEKLQLIKPLIRSNGYKDYTEQNLQQLKLIQSAKKLDFTLTEIKQRYPIAYKSNYIPSLLRLSPAEYTKAKLRSDLESAPDYYKNSFEIRLSDLRPPITYR